MEWLGDPGLVVAGVDPGLTGALAILDENDQCETIPMPVMDGILDAAAVIEFLRAREPSIVIIEQQQAWPKQGAASTFRTGLLYGQLLGALQASGWPYRLVHPARWKKALRIVCGPGLTPYQRRKALKACSMRRAIELLPKSADQFRRVRDEGNAEAALIAWWYLHDRPRTKKNILEEAMA